MNGFIKQCTYALFGFAYVVLGALPVLADDTEIYFGSSSGIKNNILFMIDTSGSMDSQDDTTTSRIDKVKAAFKTLLHGLDNVNVGLMRFSDPGGPVLYPVTDINTILPVASGALTVTTKVAAGGDDGYQRNDMGSVSLATANLEIGSTIINGATNYTSTRIITAKTNDADGCLSDSSTNTNRESLLTYSSTTGDSACPSNARVAGLRFDSIPIPAGTADYPVTIDSAVIQFVVSGSSGTVPVDMVFKGEKVSRGAFSTGKGSGDPADRPTDRWSNTANITTAQTVTNFNPSALPVDTLVTSGDVSGIVQEAVNDGSWAVNKAITILYKRKVDGTPDHVDFYSADSKKNGTAPTLVVNYHVGTGTGSTPSTTTAVQFQSVSVPRHAKITSAYLEFTAASSISDATSLNVYAEKSGVSTALSASLNNLSNRAATSAKAIWDTSSTPAMSAWTAGTAYQSPDLKSVVQELVDQSDWCGGNAMTFLLSGTGHRIAASYDSGSTTAPKLVLVYDKSTVPTDGTSCKQVGFTRQISAGADDAQEDDDTSPADITAGSLNLAANPSKSLKSLVGLRFTNVAIPKGATIQSAYLQFTASTLDSSSVGFVINGQLDGGDNPATFAAADDNIKNRTKTSATVTWGSLPTWTKDTRYLSPDIRSVVQELVNRSAWYTGNSMAFVIDGTSTANKRSAYSFNSSQGNSPKLIVNYIDDGQKSAYTVRDKLVDIVNSLTPSGSTPLQDTFLEGINYFRGEAVNYGKKRGSGPYAYTRVSHPDSMVAGTYTVSSTPAAPACQESSASSCKSEQITGSPIYKSPITNSCQANHMVLLTDGQPNSDHSTAAIKSLIGATTCTYAGGGECVSELAYWANKTADISAKSLGSANLDGAQRLVVDTIAFYQEDEDGNQFLKDVASPVTGGNGVYQKASSASELTEALEKISAGVVSENTSFVSAGAAVNAFNRTLNRDDLYFAVFKPKDTPRWPGNLKKYKIAFDSSGDPYIQDAVKAAAVDTKTGYFTKDSKSYWSAAADGPDVQKGGAGALITDYKARTHLYTNVGSSADLADLDNLLVGTNTLLTKALFNAGAYSDADFANLIDWTLGANVGPSQEVLEDKKTIPATRYVFADPLHSRPVAITYGGTEKAPDVTVFVSSNSGFLHAIDDDDGKEVFSFIPKELLPLQKTLYENAGTGVHPYGLDGSITTWVIDPDGDGLVLDSDGKVQKDNQVILTVGMRRGGRNYYAVDVTDRSHPKLLWTIRGGLDSGFEQMGETWSQPVKARIRIGSAAPKRVLIFGGGYDPVQDSTTTRKADSMGAAIYIVDQLTGQLIWSGGKGVSFTKSFSDMNYGIPATVTGADVSGDGLMDYFFVGDMGGQVWRFDINNGASDAATLVKGGVIADLGVAGGGNTAADNRRFYHGVSLFAGLDGSTPYLGVAIGSGWRAHPLSLDTTDRFYVIRQANVLSAPTSYTKILETDLYDATNNLIGEGTATQKIAELTTLASKKGWYISMGSGEKVLSTPLVINGDVLFDTYSPGILAGGDPCAVKTGTNRSYLVKTVDATPSEARSGVVASGSAALTKDDRSYVLNVPGIVDGARLTITSSGAAVVEAVNTSKKDMGPADDVHRIYWNENRAR